MSDPISLQAYRLAMGLASPAAPLLLRARARNGKEAAPRLGERLGRAGRPRPEGSLVWLHGASVGEGMSLLPLVERLGAERPDLGVLVTSGTRTSAELLGQRLPSSAIHQFAPIDTPGAVARFLDHWRPAAGLFVESELWPNLILAARARGVKLALVSARMTEASARGWARGPGAARAVLGAFDVILAQDEASAARLAALGGHVAGRLNLKRVGAPLATDPDALAALTRAIGDRRVLLAASTHDGEELLIAEAAIASPSRRALLIIVPRHPERGDAIAGDLAHFRIVRRSKDEPLGDADVYLADTLGEIGLFYRLADLVVMGGSFVAGVGGHNPLEAARVGRGVVSGPSTANHAEVFAEMAAASAALIVAPGPPLRAALADLFAAPERMLAMGERAAAFAAAQGAGFEAGWSALLPLLPAA